MKPFSRRDILPPDHYVYDEIPEELRQKIIFCMNDTVDQRDPLWGAVEKKLTRAYGRPFLVAGPNPYFNVTEFLRNCEPIEAVDVVECYLSELRSLWSAPHLLRNFSFEDNLRHMNNLFGEYGVGYEFTEKNDDEVMAVRIDSKYLHESAIKKTFKLLHDLNFRGPLDEFEDAIEALDNRDTDKAITDALKAFESTMKAILQELSYAFDPSWSATKLIDACIKADVIPSNLGSFSNGIRTILESGLPTVRNMPGPAHGSGRDPKDVKQSYAQFAVNLCGSYIVFLIERYEEKK